MAKPSSSTSSANSNGDGDEERVDLDYSNYIGRFEDADGACGSLGSKYTFGAPRTAYENQQLLMAMDVRGGVGDGVGVVFGDVAVGVVVDAGGGLVQLRCCWR